VEATYLVKKKIAAEALTLLEKILAAENSPFRAIGLILEVAKAVRAVPRNSIPDLPDRVMAATSLTLRLPRVTRDGKIRASGIDTIW
jgi:hypothetical protein